MPRSRFLIGVWRLAGMSSGKYLAATMKLWLPKFEEFGEFDTKRLTPAVRLQLMQVSGATIDRLLKPTKDAEKPKGLSATKAWSLLRNSITVHKAGDGHEQLLPGFIEADWSSIEPPPLPGNSHEP